MSQLSDIDSLPFSAPISGPDYSIETRIVKSQGHPVAGVDEAGRGPLAGPVVAAAVILDPQQIPVGLNDSKQLSESRRKQLFDAIVNTSIVAWSASPAAEIDRINIREATLVSMVRAVHGLAKKPSGILIDGRDIPIPLIKTAQALVKGDTRSVSIAAASIIAKVIRDRIMCRADMAFPEYGFAGHKGYATASHREAIQRCGPCSLHRTSFAPMKFM